MSDLKFWLGFNLVKGVGPTRVKALQEFFGSLETAWCATESELQKIGFDRRTIASFQQSQRDLNLEECLAKVTEAGLTLISWDSPDYPSYLREIPKPPPLLYVKGKIEEIDRFAVAVVGTRRLTSYGRQITRELVSGLVASGVTVVSGLARGIDGIAHKTALEFGGRTLAVLGSGIDRIYPAEHTGLVDRILAEQRGAVISEYGLGVKPDSRNFPQRNRIISGLSLGVVVVEAGQRSGALITSKFALEQGREVFAVPGNVNSPASKGPNRLIQDGAKLVSTVEDILEELNLKMVLEQSAVQMVLPDSAEEAALMAQLSSQPTHIDELIRAANLPSSLVGSTLTMMELKGMVHQVGGMNYVLSREPEPAYDVVPQKE